MSSVTSHLPDFYSDHNIALNLILCISITRSLAVISLVLRLVSRRISNAKYWWDDWWIIVATLFHIPGEVVELLEIRIGGGRHLGWVIEHESQNLPRFQKLFYIDELLYPPTLGPVKLSILFLYIRLFGVRKVFRNFCYIMVGLVAAWALITELLFIFQCSPIWVAWDRSNQVGSCLDSAKLFTGTNTVNVIMDFIILAMPIIPIWKLNVSKRQRLVIAGILAFGGGTVVLSTLRLAMIGKITLVDLTWDDGRAIIWSVTEATISIVLANIPLFGPLLPKRWIGAVTEDKSSQYKRHSYGKMDGSSIGPKDHDLEMIIPAENGLITRTTEISVIWD